MQSTANTTTPVKIFITGATGYIGGTVLMKLLESSQPGRWDITALTRSESSFPKFKELGVKPLLGSLDDSEILTKAASETDVILHLADADHLGAAKALAKGANNTTGKRKIYIQCSGTGVLVDNARGDSTGDKIYSDLDMEAIHAIPVTNPHRDVDTYLFENSQNFDLIIVAPPTIHGIGTGPFKRLSQQIPALIKLYSQYGRAATAGKGINIWNNVHIEDLADFFVLLVEKALEGKVSTGKDGWYFVESGEHQLKDVVARIGKELHKHNVIKEAEAGQFKTEEVDTLMGPYGWMGIASNSRCRADRARALGWKPKGTRDNIYESVAQEVEAILAEGKPSN